MLSTKVLDVEKIREDFPILKRTVHGKPLVYLDNAATSQKPRQVIGALAEYYERYNANVHRAVHRLSEEATEAYEDARGRVADFINTAYSEEIIFARNTTESINLVAYSWGRANIQSGDRVILTEMEHHSNLVPWQRLAKEKKADLQFIPINDEGLLRLEELDGLLNSRVKIIALTHVSNVLGTINPVNAIAKRAHEYGAIVLLDGAQSVPHMPIDVRELECDFLAFSGHKMLGPTGIGVLYGRKQLLQNMEPFLGGGDMIKEVHLRDANWNDLPWKFEAGTSNIADAIAFGVAIDYLNSIGMESIRRHEKELTAYALAKLSDVKGLRLFGPMDVEKRGATISFNLGDIHPHDLATILDSQGIAIRSGHHCAQPLMERLGVSATSRASFYLYNMQSEVDILVEALEQAGRVFRI